VTAQPVTLPPAAAELVDELGALPGLAPVRKPGPARPVQRWSGDAVVVDVAVGDEGRRLIRLEADGRRWATTHGVPTPPLLGVADDASWLVTRRVRGTSCRGERAVRAAMTVADAIARAPAPVSPVAATVWRGTRATLAQRAARSVAAGLPVHAYRRARAAVAELDEHATAHGDLYRRNVITTDGARVWVIDWEFLGSHPRWTDHLRLWSTLTDPVDREIALGHVLTSVSRSDQEHVAVLIRYLTLRLLAENLAAARRWRNADDVEHARRMVAEGEAVARQLT
jgi:aminoglycoside phosphotransferase